MGLEPPCGRSAASTPAGSGRRGPPAGRGGVGGGGGIPLGGGGGVGEPGTGIIYGKFPKLGSFLGSLLEGCPYTFTDTGLGFRVLGTCV